jgi:Ca2+-transporting ATPase
MSDPIVAPWAVEGEAVAAAQGVTPAQGLTDEEAARRLAAIGPNRPRALPQRSVARIWVDQFRGVVVGMLGIATIVALVARDFAEAAAIAVVLLLNATIGFVTEWRAVRSLDALRRLARMDAVVRRSGRVRSVPAEELVPGDVVLLEAGDRIPADLRLLVAASAAADESALTGESIATAKRATPVDVGAAVLDRDCMVFQGTALVRGSCEGIVVATGTDTELGRVAALAAVAKPERTPLEKRLDRLGQRLVVVSIGIAATLGFLGWRAGHGLQDTLQTAIALAVATVPEGLPVVATLALARGVLRLAKRRARVVKLSAVEALGATSVILCDKTGTLTENRMSVVAIELASARVSIEADASAATARFTRDGGLFDPASDPVLGELLRASALCSNASLQTDGDRWEVVGDPTETALLVAAARAGLLRDALLAAHPELVEVPFDSDSRRMATVHADGSGVWIAAKGAPETLLAACSRVATPAGERALEVAERAAWLARNEALAAQGLRVLAIASRRAAAVPDEAFDDLVLLGLVGLLDPPRAGVREALAACRRAGIRVVVATGDQPATARTVAVALGLLGPDAPPQAVLDASTLGSIAGLPPAPLLEAQIIARASPPQKLELVALHQRAGAVVAMTGDGVNDAPALRKADIGIAMGLRGTQVAREAAAMVLEDDAFASIVSAVEQGRAIFGNIRRLVVYLLTCNASEVGVVALAGLAGMPLPLAPLQILFLNLVTDVFPALALGLGPPPLRGMECPPRPPGDPIVSRAAWSEVAIGAVLLTLGVVGAYAVALGPLGVPHATAMTIAFLTLAAAQLLHVFAVREPGVRVRDSGSLRNPWVWASLALCSGLLALALTVPALARALEMQRLDARGFALVAIATALPFVLGEVVRALRRTRARAAS